MYVVQIIYVCCDRLLDIAGRACSDETHKGGLFHTSNRLLGSTAAVTNNSASNQALTAASRYFTAESSNPATLNACFTTESRLQVVNLRPTISSESFLPVPVHGRLSPLPLLTTRQSANFGLASPLSLRQSWVPGSRSDDHISLPGTLTARSHTGSSPVECVSMSIACTEYPPEALAKVEGYKQKLNTSMIEWKRLCAEKDPHVLSALMWDWIDELKVCAVNC